MLCLKAHAKINWTLDILGTREDGYHLMDMLMQSVDMHDTLWLEEADTLTLEDAAQVHSARNGSDADDLSSAAVTYDESNLVYRAAKKLREYCGVEKGARMRLLKTIPSGAGMGGGSADAAAALRGLVQLWDLDISEEELLKLGLSLGADIPFMLTGGLARVGGIGGSLSGEARGDAPGFHEEIPGHGKHHGGQRREQGGEHRHTAKGRSVWMLGRAAHNIPLRGFAAEREGRERGEQEAQPQGMQHGQMHRRRGDQEGKHRQEQEGHGGEERAAVGAQGGEFAPALLNGMDDIGIARVL